MTPLWDTQETTCLFIDPENENIVWVGTGDYHGRRGLTNGLWKTESGGLFWQKKGGTKFDDLYITHIFQQKEAPLNMVITTSKTTSKVSDDPGGGIWWSDDGGETWNAATGLPANSDWDDFDASKFTNGFANYIAVGPGNNGGNIFKSTNLGHSWTRVTSPDTTTQDYMRIAYSRLSKNRFYVLATGSQKVYKTTDLGATWLNKTAGLPQHDPYNTEDPTDFVNWSQKTYDAHIETSAVDDRDVVFVGLITLAASINGGDNWSDIGLTYYDGARTHNDQHCLFVHPTLPNWVFVGNDGGIYKVLHDQIMNNAYYTPVNDTIYDFMVYGMSLHPNNLDWVMAGMQDSGYGASRGSLSEWKNISSGDGIGSAFVKDNPAKHYVSMQKGSIYEFDGNTDTVPVHISAEWTSPDFDAPFILIGSGSTVIAGVDDGVWIYTGLPGMWMPMKVGIGTVTELAVAPSNGEVIYAGTLSCNLWKYDPALGEWIQLDDLAVPNFAVGAITVNYLNPHDIIVGTLGDESGQLFRCRDTRVVPQVWIDISGSSGSALPASPINTVAIDPWNLNILYVGTDVGLFMSADDGASWVNMHSLGLPKVPVTDLKISRLHTYLYAATWGRGIWRIPLKWVVMQSTTVAPVSIDSGNNALGQVTLSDYIPFADTLVTLTDNTELITLPATVKIQAGQKSALFPITTKKSLTTVTRQVSGIYGGITRSANIELKRVLGVQSLTLTPPEVYGGGASIGSVTMNFAPTAATVVSLSDNSSAIVTDPTVTVGANATGANFVVDTLGVSANARRTVTAAYNGFSATASLLIKPVYPTSLTLDPTSVKGGTSTTGTVRLIDLAPPGGSRVTITTNSGSVLPPANTTVLENQVTSDFIINTRPVAAQANRNVYATLNGVTKVATLTLTP